MEKQEETIQLEKILKYIKSVKERATPEAEWVKMNQFYKAVQQGRNVKEEGKEQAQRQSFIQQTFTECLLMPHTLLGNGHTSLNQTKLIGLHSRIKTQKSNCAWRIVIRISEWEIPQIQPPGECLKSRQSPNGFSMYKE